MKAVACAFKRKILKFMYYKIPWRQKSAQLIANQGVSISTREEPLGILDEPMPDWINEKQDETPSSGPETDIDSVKLV